MLRLFFALSISVFISNPALACSNPTGVEGEIIYNDDHKLVQFCDGTSWRGLGNNDVTTALSNLTDTNVTPTDGQILIWDNANSEWISADNAGSGWQVPDDASVCNAGIEGTLRYNSDKMQVCVDGTGWVDIGGVGVTNGKFVDGTDTNEAVYTAGNVGIGTTDPTTELHVEGTTTTDGVVFKKVSGLAAPTATAGWNWDSGNLNFQSGNVGIGTTSPQQLLHIQGSWPSLTVEDDASGDPAILFSTGWNTGFDDSGWTLRNDRSDSNKFQWRYNNSKHMTLDTSGNVGIGTTSPDNKLTLTGVGDVTGANAGGGLLIEDSDADATGIKLRIDGNEVQTSDDGLASQFLINPFGGDVRLGSDSVVSRVRLMDSTYLDFDVPLVGTLISMENQTFIKKTSDRGGASIGRDDTIILGSGESPATVEANVNNEAETTYIVSDNDVFIYADLQSGWSSRKEFRFDDNGSAYKSGGGSWSATSDARLKTVEANYENGLAELLALRPVIYHYNHDNPRGEPSDRSHIGLVAQEAMQHMPELVSAREDDGYYDLDPSALTFALINAVSELNAEILELREEIQSMHAAQSN